MSNRYFRPRSIQVIELATGFILAIILIISAVALGSVALKFGVEVFKVILSDGIDVAMKRLSATIETRAVRDVLTGAIDGFNVGTVQERVSQLLALLAVLIAPLLYVGVWLIVGKLAMRYIISGIWGLQSGDYDDSNFGKLPSIQDVNAQLLAVDHHVELISQEDRLLLSKMARYAPRLYRYVQKQLRAPLSAALMPTLRYFIKGGIACLVVIAIAGIMESGLSLLFVYLYSSLTGTLSAFGGAVVLLLIFGCSVAAISALIDLRFARALSPKTPPLTDQREETLRDQTKNAPPAQFASMLQTELGIQLGYRRCSIEGVDLTKIGFVDNSNFQMNVMVEGESKVSPGYAIDSARYHAWFGAGLIVVGSALALFWVFPSGLRDLMEFREFRLIEASYSPLWMLLAVGVGRFIRLLGQKTLDRAEAILSCQWSEVAVVTLRVDGTVNTSTGEALDKSHRTESRYQETRFDVRIVSANLTCISAEAGKPRAIFAFERTAESDTMHDGIFSLIQKEGSDTAITAISRTINDSQRVAEAIEQRRAALQLQIARTQDELRRLGLDAPGDQPDGSSNRDG